MSKLEERIFWTYKDGYHIIKLTRDLLVYLPSSQTDLSHFILFKTDI